MNTDIQSGNNTDLKIGDIFTPILWGRFAVEKFNIFHKWMDGATIFDPTMGQGDLLSALIIHGLDQGVKPKEMPILNLFGNEMNYSYYKQALQHFHSRFNIDMSPNFTNRDILELNPRKHDILLGNPPWQNFNDLPPAYKEKIKPAFEEFKLTGNKKDLLLGRSRIDIAALIIKASIQNFLKQKGEAFFFMPMSLLLNDGAHESFRNYTTNTTNFAPVEVFDFSNVTVFENIATRYGLTHFKRNIEAKFPIPWHIRENDQWVKYKGAPLRNITAPVSVFPENKKNKLNEFRNIQLKKHNTPRQGLNTCGANKIFFFKEHRQLDTETCLLDNNTKLPSQFIHPLLTAKNFRNQTNPEVWVLIPYNRDGRPISEGELSQFPELKTYLNKWEQELKGRKGTLIRSWIKKGRWWAMLGVGPYNFAPYKIVWEAYGRKTFAPKIFEGYWQANQALQAFIPCNSKQEAAKILKQLQNPVIEEILLSYQMGGTMNWAQPGKIKRLIDFT